MELDPMHPGSDLWRFEVGRRVLGNNLTLSEEQIRDILSSERKSTSDILVEYADCLKEKARENQHLLEASYHFFAFCDHLPTVDVLSDTISVTTRQGLVLKCHLRHDADAKKLWAVLGVQDERENRHTPVDLLTIGVLPLRVKNPLSVYFYVQANNLLTGPDHSDYDPLAPWGALTSDLLEDALTLLRERGGLGEDHLTIPWQQCGIDLAAVRAKLAEAEGS